MFKNIGGKIKIVAKICFGLNIVAGVLCFIAFIMSDQYELAFISVFGFPICGYVLAIIVHGFGNLVEDTGFIRNRMTPSAVELARLEEENLLKGLENLSDDEKWLELGKKYFKGEKAKRDYTKAAELFAKSANAGNVRAMYNLSVCYLNGYGVDKNDEKAIAMMRNSANAGNAQAMYKLGKFYELGEIVPKDLDEAISWFEKSAAKGNENAKNMLSQYAKIDDNIE